MPTSATGPRTPPTSPPMIAPPSSTMKAGWMPRDASSAAIAFAPGPPPRSRVNGTGGRGRVGCRYSWRWWNGAVSTPLAPPKEIVRNRRARASRSAAAAVSSAMAGAGSEGICRVWWVAVLATSTATSATAAPPSANRALFTMPLVFGGPLRWRLGGNAANSLFARGGGGDGAPPDAPGLVRELDPHDPPQDHRPRDERPGGHRVPGEQARQEEPEPPGERRRGAHRPPG